MMSERGRPSLFTLELAEEIASRLSKGEPLAAICRDDRMPTDRTVRNWREGNEVFSSAIAHAREVGFDAIALECLEIGDSVEPDAAEVSKAKLRVETRLKLLAKWDPKRYGEKVALTGGSDDDSPIKTVTRIELVAPHDDSQT